MSREASLGRAWLKSGTHDDVRSSSKVLSGAKVFLDSRCDDASEIPVPGSRPGSVPELIADAFGSLSLVPAAEFQGGAISRTEIAERSDRLAEWLVAQAAGTDCLVGIFMERSVEMLIGILGVMKAGAAYVPLDPAFPRARNEQILNETQVPVLLTLRRHLQQLPKSGARIMCLDSDASELDKLTSAVGTLPEVLPEMRAYVIFTSGSTGRPKGVEVTHGSVVNLLMSAIDLLDAGPGERLVAVTTLAFDISVLELLLPLVCGGTVVIADKQEASDALLLKELLRRSRATMLQATPVTFRSLLELGFEAPPGFKMMCGGEAWAPAMAERLLAKGGRLWNMYGPTETTVWSSIGEVKRGVGRITIGPPIAETRFYVMDAEKRLTPASGTGELWIAGSGVARGYLNRPELTAERFTADPFVAGERMYRTGDEVRPLEDGTIEFIGRLDSQVKLRGFRIELGEIEAVMLTVSGVRAAVAMLRKNTEAEDFLAAAYVGESQLAGDDIRRVLLGKLPAYMVPKLLLRLDSLPLTPNGKTDRRAVAQIVAEMEATPVIERGDAHASTSGKPTGIVQDIEHRMLVIWQGLFPGAAIMHESSFFDLGGDSLLLVRLQSRIASEFDLRLTMADVTQHDSFSGMVHWANESLSPPGDPASVKELHPAVLRLQSSGSGTPIFVIPQMLIFRTLAEELGTEQPFYALQIPDEDVPDGLESVRFEELAALYCKQIRAVQPEGPYRLGGWCLWGWMAYEVAHRLESEGAEVELLAIIDAWAPGYWQRYPPVQQFFVNASHFWHRVRWYADSMNSLPVPRRIADGLRRLREMAVALLRALPRGLRPELEVVEKLRIQRFAAKAAEAYRPGPMKGNVVLFKSELRPTGPRFGEDMGWSAVVGRTVQLDSLPGNHTDIFNLPAARMMAERLRESLGLTPVVTGSVAARK